jgi:hypothetical protein
MILAPCALYFYLAHPAWTWLYLVDPARVPRIAVITILAAWSAACIGAYYGGAWLLRNGKERGLAGALAGGAAFVLLLLVLLRGRVFRYGSYGDWHDGRALSLGEVKLGYVLIAVMLGVVSSAVLVCLELRRDGRRVASR